MTPLFKNSAIFFMDDWGTDVYANQKQAFVEFLDDNPDVYADELPNYSFESRVFYMYRGPRGHSWQERINSLG